MTLAVSPSSDASWRYRAASHPHIVPVRTFQDNYVWLMDLPHQSGARQAVVVDPGDAAPVRAALEAAGLTLAAILVTHHHADHTGGIADLKAAWPQAVVYGPRRCSNPLIQRRYDHGDKVMLDGFDLSCSVIEVPGHTLDHNAYFFERVGDDPRPVLFCGDTLFAGGCGRIFEGTPSLMHDSLARLTALPPRTMVYCAHEYTLANLRFAIAAEPGSEALGARLREAESIRARDLETVPSTIGIELETNPFVRVSEPAVRMSVRGRGAVGGGDENDGVAVFAALRQWKNDFKG